MFNVTCDVRVSENTSSFLLDMYLEQRCGLCEFLWRKLPPVLCSDSITQHPPAWSEGLACSTSSLEPSSDCSRLVSWPRGWLSLFSWQTSHTHTKQPSPVSMLNIANQLCQAFQLPHLRQILPNDRTSKCNKPLLGGAFNELIGFPGLLVSQRRMALADWQEG